MSLGDAILSYSLTMIDVHAIPAFTDNYLWLLVRGSSAVVVDPGDAVPVRATLASKGLNLAGILITHWHPDHIGGLPQLATHDMPVYGPAAEAPRIPGLTQALKEGDRIEVLGTTFSVLELPGHTLGHIAYYSAPSSEAENGLLFCGDTLFSAGCGRLFEGTAQQMHAALTRLAALPAQTPVYCTHEYTLSNLAFAWAVEPDNPALRARITAVRELRARNLPSLPTDIGLERASNPFLRVDAPTVRKSAETWAATELATDAQVFAALRRWKDGFRGTDLP